MTDANVVFVEIHKLRPVPEYDKRTMNSDTDTDDKCLYSFLHAMANF